MLHESHSQKQEMSNKKSPKHGHIREELTYDGHLTINEMLERLGPSKKQISSIASPMNHTIGYSLKNRKPISHRLKNELPDPSPKQNLQDFIEVYNIKR